MPDLLHRADKAFFEAKEAERDRMHVAAPECEVDFAGMWGATLS